MFSVYSRVFLSAHLNEVGNIYSCMGKTFKDLCLFFLPSSLKEAEL